MRTHNCLDAEGIARSGLFFITSGEVRRAIGAKDPFKNLGDPAERLKKTKELSSVIEKEVNKQIKTKLAPKATARTKTR